MSSALDLSHRQAEPTLRAEFSTITPSVDLDAPAPISRCRAIFRRTRLSVERGATAVEYALMVGLISVGIVTAVTALKDKTTDSLNQTAASTSGLIFPPRVKAGAPFTVKYIRNDLGVGGWTSVGTPGASHGQAGAAGAAHWDNLTKNGVEWTATLRAPSAGTMQVQVRTVGVTGKILETGVLRVIP